MVAAIARGSSVGWDAVFRTAMRVIFFRASQDELVSLGWRHLALGLVCTWIVGIGRYWDNPKVGLLQHLGIGSLIYVFVLALFLWLIIWPLRPSFWSYFRVLTFITLVSPPAIIYAIPVQKFFTLNTANSINAWFLGIVAIWRVALLFFFLRRLGNLPWLPMMAATLLPLTLIVIGLTILNLERAVFELMGGITERSPNDTSYEVLVLISWLSFSLSIPLFISYVIAVLIGFSNIKDQKADVLTNDDGKVS